MASTVFVDYDPSTPIVAAWLNDVNVTNYVTVPAVLAEQITIVAEQTTQAGQITALQSAQTLLTQEVAKGNLISAAAAGTVNAVTATIANSPLTALVDREPFIITSMGANTGAMTLTLTLGTTVLTVAPIVKGNNQSVIAGDSGSSGYPMVLNWSTAYGAYVLQNPINGSSSASLTRAVRQTVQQATLNSSGYANMLQGGTGLTLNLFATATPMVTTFAQGLNDSSATLSADTAAVVTLPANNLSFVTQDFASSSSVVWGNTLAPVQYGYSYNQAAQSTLQFGGGSGSVTFLDDYGNVWAAQGGAKIQNTQFKFGTGALGGGGTSNALNGTTDFIQSSSFTSLGGNGWSLRCWFYPTSLAASYSAVFGITNISGYGVSLGVTSAGKTNLQLSSTGTSTDISNNTLGTVPIAVNNWYFIELTYDSVSGKYLLYVNGVLDQTILSALRICAVSNLFVGKVNFASQLAFTTGYIDKFEFLPYCDHPNGTTYTVPTAAPNITNTGHSSDFFSIPQMTMNKLTGVSTVAGTNPTFTPVNRVYVGEAVTGTATVSSTVNYAVNGKYDSGWTTPLPAAAISTIKNSNLGIPADTANLEVECITADTGSGYSVGDRLVLGVSGYNSTYGYPISIYTARTTLGFTSASTSFGATNKATGNFSTLVTANWKYKLTAKRGW